ncbi:hypothetical protein C8R46DRAFT_513657 [Mycena filopes]|nr:hypothetical protein C8R46DRAFT_513657 [Mycena filopes]
MPKIFRGVKYHIPAAYPEPRRTELALLLKKHHAKRAATVFDATHIITNCEDFKGCEEIDVSVVTGLWVEHSIAAKKIQSFVDHWLSGVHLTSTQCTMLLCISLKVVLRSHCMLD